MITDLTPYPEMKDSGAEWLGEVPVHWEVRRLGNLLKERAESNAMGEIHEVLSLTRDRGVIPYAEKGNIGNKASEDITRYKIVRRDDVVVNCMNVIIGPVGISRYTGCLSPVYYVLTRRSEADNPRFLDSYFQTKQFQRSLVRIGNGILAHRMRIPMELLKCELFPRPPLSEQTAIVRYLDHVDRQVRQLVRAKRKLIALLTEHKQAIIHRAVTRGLDPVVPLKDSGLEWFGEVPVHWGMLILGRGLRNIGQGWSPVAAEGQIADDQWAVLTLSAIRRGNFNPDAVKPISESAQIPDDIEISNGDLLLSQSNTRELVGDTCIIVEARQRTVISDLIYRLTPDLQQFVSTYLMYFLLSRISRRQFEQDARGSSGTMPKNSQRHIRSWRVPTPPIDEQKHLVDFITTELSILDTTITRATREFELLNEYRTRLIADVVTGKLDVREAATRIPDQLDEPDDAGNIDDPLDVVEADSDEEQTHLDEIEP